MTLILLVSLSILENKASPLGLKLKNLESNSSFSTYHIEHNYLFNASNGYKEDSEKQPTLLNCGLEVLGGYACEICAGIGFLFGIIAPTYTDASPSTLTTTIVATIGCSAGILSNAGGVSLAGKLMNQEGSFKRAVIGAGITLAVGFLLSYSACYISDYISGSDTAIEGGIIGCFLALPIGAMIGYNW